VHLVYLLDGTIVKPFRASSIFEAVPLIFSRNAMTYVPLSFSVPRDKAGEMLVEKPSTAWELMGGTEGSFLDVYGGEWQFDWWTLRSVERLGSDNGINIRYGVNLVDFEQDLDLSECYTGVLCYAQKDDQIVYGEIAQAPGNHLRPRILPVDATDRFEHLPSVQQLTAEARRYAISNKVNEPRLSWTVDFVPLDQTEEYKDLLDEVEKLDIGDTVNVHVDKLGIDIEARVKAIRWDVLLERYSSVTIGNAKPGIADTIASIAKQVRR
jgi:phage minor structural protein